MKDMKLVKFKSAEQRRGLGNAGEQETWGGIGAVVAERKQTMAAYDALPREARLALGKSSVKISPITTPAVIERFGLHNLPLLIEKMEAQTFGPSKRSNLHPKDCAA